MKKTNILFLHPGPIYRPDLADFRDKYTMLSQNYKGVIFTWTSEKKFKNYRIGDFYFQPISRKGGGYLTKLILGLFMIIKGCTHHYKKERFQIIICYDPLSTGIIGAILKCLLGCKLIIEINGNLLNAGFLGQNSISKKFKLIAYKILIKFSLVSADTIKLVNQKQKEPLGSLIEKKKIFCFDNFVPTHYFMRKCSFEEKYILFVGFPFYLKGVDILIKAFQIISDKYPNFILKLIGHRLENDAKQYFDNLNGRVQFRLPVFYDKLREEFLKCYCFVLPSREEGKGRVLLEAMSSGKPLIGANVGGIPEIIDDGKNGFLFESEDVNELAAKLDILLGNPGLARKMGEYGKKLAKEKFSSEKYCQTFKDMIYATL